LTRAELLAVGWTDDMLAREYLRTHRDKPPGRVVVPSGDEPEDRVARRRLYDSTLAALYTDEGLPG
jgi:hypothetical protein